jgi:hypothetical protein
MKGYLQRLVASAVQPQRAVHPVVSTLFSGARHEEVAEETVSETPALALPVEREVAPDGMEAARVHAPLEPAGSPDQAGSARMRLEPAPPRLLKERVMSSQRQEEMLSAHPVELLLPPVEPETPAGTTHVEARAEPSEEARSARRAWKPQSEPVPLQPLSPQGQPLLVEEWTGSARDEGEMPARSPRNHAPQANPTAWPVTATQRLRAERMSPNVGREHQRGSDDIQIHIGRIEVVAVPQATPRSAAPARKSQTLDEYLKRRDGRAR